MSQILKPKPLPENPYVEIELVYGKEWKWKVPTKFGFGIRNAFNRVATDKCFAWLMTQMKSMQTRSDDPPSQLESGIGRALVSTMQTQLIPDDNQVQKYISRFYWYNNEETLKEQMDLLCTPLSDAPKASVVIGTSEADEDVVRSVITYFLDIVNPPDLSESDSLAEEKLSKKTEDINI